jgi:hypothetical protein
VATVKRRGPGGGCADRHHSTAITASKLSPTRCGCLLRFDGNAAQMIVSANGDVLTANGLQ